MKTFIVLNLCLTSVLALDKAHHQHMSLRKKHRDEPDVSMSPMEATVKEGTIFFFLFSAILIPLIHSHKHLYSLRNE